MSSSSQQTFVGPMIHCDAQRQLIVHQQAQIDVKNGKIERILVNPQVGSLPKKGAKYLKPGQFLVPGFVDGHIHAVQMPNMGLGYDKGLLDWLDTYTFPLERKYVDNKFADKVFDAVVKKTLRMGTTTACYYASLHASASLILAKKVVKHGQRALVGKVNMNCCQYDDYVETEEHSLKETQTFVENILNIRNPLVQAIVTPRFALSCDLALMKQLADLARKKNLHIQTHISENKEEVKAVEALYSNFSSYAEVYDAANLLTNKTVLAHGVYLSDNELNIINKRGTSVIHCPSSNTCLKSGLCDVRRLLNANIKLGLGTDISGGNFPSILDVMRAALQVSVHLSFSKHNYKPLNYKEVFYLATLGGADALAMSDQIGNFEVGKEFDALIVDVSAPGSLLDNFLDYSLEENLQRFVYSGDDRNIAEVYVSGKHVA